jgi:serpin B
MRLATERFALQQEKITMTIERTFGLMAALSLGLVACEVEEPACEGSAREIQAADEALQEIVEGNGAFALDLFRKLATPGENFFFSPFSISIALGMTEMGANGNTEAEMAALLRVSADEGAWHQGLGALGSDIGSGEHCSYELALANQLFAQVGYPFHQAFLDGVDEAYQAPVENLDIQGDTENSRLHINSWVSDITHAKIPELLKPGVLNSGSVMVLVNAIYFKGDWAEQFKLEDTQEDGIFTKSDGSEVSAALMWGELDAAYQELADGAQVLDLAYAGEELSMTVVLPPEGQLLADFEAQLTAESMAAWTDGLQDSAVYVTLPRFEMRSAKELKEVLTELGMVDVFLPGAADLSGMADADLFISAVIHEAYVKVDEEGTEAAAATAVVVGETSAPMVPTFRADRPFLFQIRDRLTGSILFMGRVADPSQVPD